MDSAPRDGRLLRLRVGQSVKLGTYGRHGHVFGWLDLDKRGSGLFWPEPDGWAFPGEAIDRPRPVSREPRAALSGEKLSQKWWAVYAIGCGEYEPIKIGYSHDPASRLKQMEVGCPFNLRIYAAMFGEAAHVPKVESHVHATLTANGRHHRGEWFRVTPAEAIKAIGDSATAIGVRLLTPEQTLRVADEIGRDAYDAAKLDLRIGRTMDAMAIF